MPYNYYFKKNGRRPYRRRNARPIRALRSEPESKYFNNVVTHSATTDSTTILTGMAAGTGVQERVGRKIKTLSAMVNLDVDASLIARCILYVPKQADQELVLTSFYLPVDNDQFWVLKDWYQSNNQNNNPQIVTHKFPMGLNCEYDGTGATALAKNPVKLLIRTSATGTVQGHTKVWYKDN